MEFADPAGVLAQKARHRVLHPPPGLDRGSARRDAGFERCFWHAGKARRLKMAPCSGRPVGIGYAKLMPTGATADPYIRGRYVTI
jgi:hypothetical protein